MSNSEELEKYVNIGIQTVFQKINFLQFGIASPDELIAHSVCEVKSTSLINDLEGTVYDPRLGVLGNGACETCGCDTVVCPGHFGHIQLEEPIIHPKFFKTIIMILKCVCHSCSACLITKEQAELLGLLKYKMHDRLKVMTEKCQKEESCPSSSCGHPRPKYILKDNKLKMYYANKQKMTDVTTKDIYDILLKISSEDTILLGFNQQLSSNPVYSNEDFMINEDVSHRHEIRPEWMIFTILPVLPPCARPHSHRDGEQHDDDLTGMYVSIIKANQKLKEDKEGNTVSLRGKKKIGRLTETERKKIISELEEHVRTLIDNTDESSKISGGRSHKDLTRRIQGKEGIVRKNIQGKRVNFSARSVIGGDPTLEIDQLGMPKEMAKKLTIPVFVNQMNIERLQKLLDDGRVNFVNRRGTQISIATIRNKEFQLQLRDVVERQLQDGDWVLFNRQPTLRVESMMALRIKVMPEGRTLRFNLAITQAYNADFDGDEMNVHIPQSSAGILELQTFMSVNSHIVSAQNNSPIVGIVQDGLLGSFLLTKPETFVKREIFFDCYMAVKNAPDFKEFLERAKSFYPNYISEDLRLAEQVPGKLLFSLIFPYDFEYEKKVDTIEGFPIVKVKNGIVLESSGPFCKKTLGSKPNTVHHFLCEEYSKEVAADFLSNVQFLINRWLPTRGFSIGLSDCMIENKSEIVDTLQKAETECQEKIQIGNEMLEQQLNGILNSTTNVGMKLTKNGMRNGKNNSMVVMYESGAKGSHINCSQVTAFVGQQNTGGKRIQKSLSHGKRALPFFEAEDDSPVARGFIDRPYMAGLRPQQMYFHAMGGREGLIDTAIKTATSGYSQRRLVKKMEDNKVHFDGTVRTNNKSIIQFAYGGDSHDASKLYYVDGEPFFADPVRIANRLNCESKQKPKPLTEKDIEIICGYLKVNKVDTPVTDSVTEKTRTKLRRLLKNVEIVPSMKKKFAEKIKTMYYRSLTEGGDMVGIISSCSIGEPTTQGTLNSVDWEEKVYVRNGDSVLVEPIGQLIDKMINESDNVKNFPNEQEYLEIPKGYEIVSVDQDGKVSWKPIKAVTRHLPGGKMVKVTLSSGRKVTATRGRSFLVRENNKIVDKRGDELKVGDRLPVTLNHPIIDEKYFELCMKIETRDEKNIFNDVFMDKVISIEEVDSSHPKVYDFTVADTLNFCLFNGIHMKDTFHFSGVSEKDVTLGVPRLQECLDATKNPKTPSCLIYFKSDELDEIRETNDRKAELEYVQRQRKKFQYANIGYFLRDKPKMTFVEEDDPGMPPIKIYKYEPHVEEWWASLYKQFHELEYEKKDWVIELEFDHEKMFQFDIELKEIASIIEDSGTFGNFSCVVSPNSIGKIYVYIDFESATEPVVSKIGLETENKKQLIDESNINFYYARDVVCQKIKELKVCGIEGISKVFPKEIAENGKTEWAMDTQGAAFKEILTIPDVDTERTTCDDFWQVYHTLGIHAARQVLYEEYNKCINSGGSSLNPRHLELLVDSMTHSGIITSVRREGIDRSVGPLAKCSFEKTVDNFAQAAMFAEQETINSVSASITLGKPMLGGTGFIDLLPGDVKKKSSIEQMKDKIAELY